MHEVREPILGANETNATKMRIRNSSKTNLAAAATGALLLSVACGKSSTNGNDGSGASAGKVEPPPGMAGSLSNLMSAALAGLLLTF